MTAVTTKSALAGNMAAPANMPENVLAQNVDARVRDIIDSVTMGSNNTTADAYILCPLYSNCVITSLKLFNDALDTDVSPAITLKIGICNGPEKFVDNGTAYAPFAAISDTLFATASTVGQAAVNGGTEFIGGAVSSTVSELANELWKRVGLSADPQKLLMVKITVNHVAATAATNPSLTIKASRMTGG